MKFSLHIYLKNLKKAGASDEYMEVVRRHAQPLVEKDLPVLLTLGHLAYATNASYSVLLGIIKREIDPYKVFAIRKRRGGKRFICVPEPALLTVQRWIHSNILCSSEALKSLLPNATAYIPGSSHIKNAKKHLGAEWILKLDITRFFESISERQVYYVFRGLGYRAQMAFHLTRLCTRILHTKIDGKRRYEIDNRLRCRTKRWMSLKRYKFLSARIIGHLPQGAPTSPMLANLTCASLDELIQGIALREGLVYTRYADDITLSGQIIDRARTKKIISELSRIIGRYGFGVNLQKTNVVKTGGRKIVTGLSVDGDVVRLPRVYKDNLRKEIYFIKKHGLQDHCARIGQKNHLSYLSRLLGKIRYLESVEPKIGDRLKKEFFELFPKFRGVEDMLKVRSS